MMRITVTGHRPNKLRGLDVDAFALAAFASRAPAGAEFNIGMALGWDLACAQACTRLGIPYRAFIPFEGQELRWPSADRMRYTLLLNCATDVQVVSRVPCREAYTDRNKVMVDNCAAVWALWDGSAGGTGHCVGYAMGRQFEVWNWWQSFLTWGQHAARSPQG